MHSNAVIAAAGGAAAAGCVDGDVSILRKDSTATGQDDPVVVGGGVDDAAPRP